MFPIRDNLQPKRIPVVTWALLALNVSVFLYQLGLPDWLLERFILLHGMIPARLTSPGWAYNQGFPGAGYLTLLTSMFLHGGWMHLLANMWTLWLFGDDVEDRLGSRRFLLLYLAAGLAAGLVHAVLFAGSTVPTIGASGAVAGVMGAFLLLFPAARIDVVVPIFFFLHVISVPAILYLPFWFLGELLSGTFALAIPQFSGIAFWAHIGGFLAGIFLIRQGLAGFSPVDGATNTVHTAHATRVFRNRAQEEAPRRPYRRVLVPDAIYGPDYIIETRR